VLFESSGLYRQSSLLKEDLATGKAIQRIDLPDWAFGEGITVMARRIIQVTWQSETGFVYDTITMKVTSTFKYSGEGWGLTNDGETIYLSDGTPSIRCLDPETFKVKRIITVRDGSEPVKLVNELEWVKGRIYANVWHSNRMAIIDSDSGAVTAWVDLSGLVPRDLDNPEAVLNGIAYDAVGDRLFVTGKLWPQLFEIRLEQAR
jgi:glutaminyl-peptide cyclotransferase